MGKDLEGSGYGIFLESLGKSRIKPQDIFANSAEFRSGNHPYTNPEGYRSEKKSGFSRLALPQSFNLVSHVQGKTD
jgi:hypothetical protein